MENENPHYITPEEAAEKDCAMRPDEWWCEGPKCMAWRWKEKTDWKEGEGLKIEWSKTHGYCGMVKS